MGAEHETPEEFSDAGWNDFPPADLDRREAPDGLRLNPLPAQHAWRAIIAGRLRTAQGGGTYEGMVGVVGFFSLKLTDTELQQAAVLGARAVVARQRRAAANTWPRLKLHRSAIYAWETHAWRWWAVPLPSGLRPRSPAARSSRTVDCRRS